MTGDHIVMSRLLVLQSSRMLLASVERKLQSNHLPETRQRCEVLRKAADKARENYRQAVLAWAAPETSQFWFVAFDVMIQSVEELIDRVRAGSHELPASDSIEIQGD